MFFVVSVRAEFKNRKINQAFDLDLFQENLNRCRVGQMNLKLRRFIFKSNFFCIFDRILTSVEGTRKREFDEK